MKSKVLMLPALVFYRMKVSWHFHPEEDQSIWLKCRQGFLTLLLQAGNTRTFDFIPLLFFGTLRFLVSWVLESHAWHVQVHACCENMGIMCQTQVRHSSFVYRSSTLYNFSTFFIILRLCNMSVTHWWNSMMKWHLLWSKVFLFTCPHTAWRIVCCHFFWTFLWIYSVASSGSHRSIMWRLGKKGSKWQFYGKMSHQSIH